jgi:ribosomal protein S18 acetylase RimI-like enzyme
VACALELIDGALSSPRGDGEYRVRVAEVAGRIAGYVCFGPTPMTDGTFDLYWLATHPEQRGRGIAAHLVASMEEELRAAGARRIRVETSTLDGYGSAHRFYARHGYPETARLPDFYKPGDDLIILFKQL